MKEQTSAYFSDIDAEENFEVQYQEELEKIHMLKKQIEQMRRNINKERSDSQIQNINLIAKNQIKSTAQNNEKSANKFNTKLVTQGNMKLATKYGTKYSIKPTTTTHVKLPKDNSKLVAKRRSGDIDWSSIKGYNYYKIPWILHLKPEEYSSYLDALRNCARKILKHCDDATYHYTDPKLIESVIKKFKENNQFFPKTISDWMIREMLQQIINNCHEYLRKSVQNKLAIKGSKGKPKMLVNVHKRKKIFLSEGVSNNNNSDDGHILSNDNRHILSNDDGHILSNDNRHILSNDDRHILSNDDEQISNHDDEQISYYDDEQISNHDDEPTLNNNNVSNPD
ncbi:16652_t:CDS:2 [Cetraspora pellucida]|uniref:16652_t:CDS:1 n=1 Tax=Cetraspora pellucida TaxID=1433469 RepID=A0A9N9JQ74_9GLOM|nr:16652_t:CDS:2 [Cetraspora pellucida]